MTTYDAENNGDFDLPRAGLPDFLADAFPLQRPNHPAEAARAVPVTGGAAHAQVPCPCACNCGNMTDKTHAEIESLSALRFLRCEQCGTQQHFGPRWNRNPGTGAGNDAHATTHTGSRTSQQVVVRKPAVDDDEEAEWERQAAKTEEDRRWTEARERWLANLPERWKMEPREGEQVLPQVEERLCRLQKKVDHGTSLLCLGPFGTGKTWVAYTYAREAVERRILWPSEIRVGTEAELVEEIALASPWEMSAKANALLRPSLKLLIIDDVGAMASYKSVENRFAAWGKIANWAYEHKRAVVLTTNKALGPMPQPNEDAAALDRLISWIGPMAYERFKHMVGKNQVFRDENKRAEMAAAWEAEYQEMIASSDNSH